MMGFLSVLTLFLFVTGSTAQMTPTLLLSPCILVFICALMQLTANADVELRLNAKKDSLAF